MNQEQAGSYIIGPAIQGSDLPSPLFGWALALGGIVLLLGYYLSGQHEASYSYRFGVMSAGFRLFAAVIVWIVALALIAGGMAFAHCFIIFCSS